MPFTYPSLPTTDSLRLLRLHPGEPGVDALSGTLTAVAFSAKPRYLCLSYTWSGGGDINKSRRLRLMHKDTGGAYIVINGHHRFHIGDNLALALLRLRSLQTDVVLWVDQICINQADIAERNVQVALMGFIYGRAVAVVSWLGLVPGQRLESPPDKPWMEESGTIGFRYLDLEAKDGFDFAKHEPQYADWVDECGRMYFTRLWIVQEVCLARQVVFLTGQDLWSEQQVMKLVRDMPRSGSKGGEGPMERLMKARAARFTPAMRLEVLIEQFAHCGCSETRDRVFGLAGLANDADPIKAPVARASSSSVPPPGRGRGTVTIDYEQSYYNIWREVVTFVLFRAKPQLDFGKLPHEQEDERRAKAVRFAGVLQNALENHVEEELHPLSPRRVDEDDGKTPVLKGYIAGTILHLGPTYSDFVGSSHHQQLWTGSWDEHYTADSDLTRLREMESTYEERIINYESRELGRIACIDSPETVAWSPLRNAEPPAGFSSAFHGPETKRGCSGEPVRFLGDKHCMGLAPASARVGDVVVRFWNCNAAIVLRAAAEECPPAGEEYDGKRHLLYGLIGRADIAEPYKRLDEYDHAAKDAMKIWEAKYDDGKYVLIENREVKTRAVYVRMGYKTLQRISSGLDT